MKGASFVCPLLLQEERLVEKDCAVWRLHGEPTVLVTLAHIFNHFAQLMVKYAVFVAFFLYCMKRQETENHPKIPM